MFSVHSGIASEPNWIEDKIENSLRMPRIKRNIMMLRAMAPACEEGVERKRKLVTVTNR